MMRKVIKEKVNGRIGISWGPGHLGIIGNDAADDLGKSGVRLTPTKPGHKTQAYIAGLRKRELLEAWRHHWTNTPNPPQSRFSLVNRLPPTLRLTERF